MRRLACCRRRARDTSIDLEHQDNTRVVTYNGLESCLLSCSHDNESGISVVADDCANSDPLDEDSSSFSSSKDVFGSSFSSQCLTLLSKQDLEHVDELDTLCGLHQFCGKDKAPISYLLQASDIETMKEKFAKLLLGDDVSGGTRGMCTATALSNAIMNLSASVFGELWKLEPLSDEKKRKWRREMDWLLSPANYMVELVPAKQNGINGRMLEIMTAKARSDVHTYLPALKKLDAMLIDVLDSMVDTEFWYAEEGSRAEGRSREGGRVSKKWWLPSPRVPDTGLSPSQRKRLGFQGKFVHQVLKAAILINEQVLLQMPVPEAVKDALPKSGKATLGDDIYYAVTTKSISVEEVTGILNLKNEHSVLDIMNQLEGTIFAWKRRLLEESIKRSPIRYPWYFVRDMSSEHEKLETALNKAVTLLRLLKTRFPNLPQTFIDVTKVQYNKDVGHSIVEAYSRVLVSLAFSILTRIGDILQEDDMKKPATPIATLKFDFFSDVYLAGITETPPGRIKRSLIDQMNMVDGRSMSNCARSTGEAQKGTIVGVRSPCRARTWLWT